MTDREDPIVEDPLDGSPVRQSILDAADLERRLETHLRLALLAAEFASDSVEFSAWVKSGMDLARRRGAARALEAHDKAVGIMDGYFTDGPGTEEPEARFKAQRDELERGVAGA